MKKIFFVLFLIGMPLMAKAQLHSSVYDQNQRKCITLNTRADNTIESVSLIGTDLTTFTFDEEGKLTEAVNSLATVEIEYDGDKAKATATIDGGKLEYHIDAKHVEEISMKEFKRQNQFLRGNKLNLLEKADKFLCQGGGKLLLDIADQTVNLVNKSVDNCFVETCKYISRAIHGVNDDKEDTMDDLKTMQDVLKGETSITDIVKDKTIGAIFEEYPSWSDAFAENLYQFVNNRRKAQKEQNAKKNAWKAGLLDAVSKGELTIEEASNIIGKVESGEVSLKDLYGADYEEASTGKRKIPESSTNVPLTALKDVLNSKQYGKIEDLTIEYFYRNDFICDWREVYEPQNGKLVLKHRDVNEHTCTEWCHHREYPFYNVVINWYSNHRTMKVADISPFGKIIKMRTVIYDDGFLGRDIQDIGNDWDPIEY